MQVKHSHRPLKIPLRDILPQTVTRSSKPQAFPAPKGAAFHIQRKNAILKEAKKRYLGLRQMLELTSYYTQQSPGPPNYAGGSGGVVFYCVTKTRQLPSFSLRSTYFLEISWSSSF